MQHVIAALQETAEAKPCFFTEIHFGFSAVVGIVIMFIGRWDALSKCALQDCTLHTAHCTLHTAPEIAVGAVTYYLVVKLRERRRAREADIELQRVSSVDEGGGEGRGAQELEVRGGERESGGRHGAGAGSTSGRQAAGAGRGLGRVIVREGAKVAGRCAAKFVLSEGKINICYHLSQILQQVWGCTGFV